MSADLSHLHWLAEDAGVDPALAERAARGYVESSEALHGSLEDAFADAVVYLRESVAWRPEDEEAQADG
jgi:hypothetical protein